MRSIRYAISGKHSEKVSGKPSRKPSGKLSGPEFPMDPALPGPDPPGRPHGPGFGALFFGGPGESSKNKEKHVFGKKSVSLHTVVNNGSETAHF